MAVVRPRDEAFKCSDSRFRGIRTTTLNVHLVGKKPLICATSHSTLTKTAPSQVGTDPEGEEDEIFFIWPTTLVHKIDEESPFYGMSARDFLKKRCKLFAKSELFPAFRKIER